MGRNLPSSRSNNGTNIVLFCSKTVNNTIVTIDIKNGNYVYLLIFYEVVTNVGSGNFTDYHVIVPLVWALT